MESNTQTRKTYLDIMRVFACAFVIFNHTDGFELYQTTNGIQQIICIVLSIVCKIGVLIFLMISGALLLLKKETMEDILKKRISRIVIVIFLFSGIVLLINVVPMIINGTAYPYSTMFTNWIYSSLTNTGYSLIPYWYLYAYLGFLFMLPFLQRICDGLTKNEILVLVSVHFIVQTVLPIFNLILSTRNVGELAVASSFNFPFALDDIFLMPLIGYYIEYHLDIEKVKKRYIYILTALLCITISIVCTSYEKTIAGSYSQKYLTLFNYILSILFYIFIKSIFCKRNLKFIVKISSLTFGIYMLDPILKSLIYKSYSSSFAGGSLVIVSSLIWIVISILINGLITCILKKMPGIRKLL